MIAIEPAMFELFREEVRAHAAALSTGLVEFESDSGNLARIEPLMRAAHSIKGAARIVGIDLAVQLAHVLEEAFVSAQAGRIRIASDAIDLLLQAADVLASLGSLADLGDLGAWDNRQAEVVAGLEPKLQELVEGKGRSTPTLQPIVELKRVEPTVDSAIVPALPPAPTRLAIQIPREPIAFGPEYGMLDLFREELRTYLLAQSAEIEALEVTGTAPSQESIETLRGLRAAALLVKCSPVAAALAALADFLGAIRASGGASSREAIGWLRHSVDVLAGAMSVDTESFPAWVELAVQPLAQIAATLQSAAQSAVPIPVEKVERAPEPQVSISAPRIEREPAAEVASPDAVVRVTAQSLNRLMGLAGESLVQARWLNVFSTAIVKLKKQHDHLAVMLDSSLQAAATGRPSEQIAHLVAETRRHAEVCRKELNDDGLDFDEHAARAEDLNSRLYREVIASRMRPFADGLHGLARTVRDMARSLGKRAHLEVVGEATEVDRDVLEKLESPLAHLIRNAVDHGLESAEERTNGGKPPNGTVRVEARHRAGVLALTIADDGRGVDLDRLRAKVVERGLSSQALVRQMSEAELLEFLFLPGFSTAGNVTEYSGRGVGLDVVQDAVRRIGGSVRITTKHGEGTTFHLQLPITLSVIRAVVVEIGGEPYAFPHTRIDRLLRIPRESVHSLEHRQFVNVDGQNVGLVLAGQLLDVPADPPNNDEMPVVLLSDSSGLYGLVVDAFRGEQDLVVRPLDPRLGKVPNLSAAAVLDDGEPVLIVDVEDLVRSMDTFIQTGALRRCEVRDIGATRKKRVLVVDDSITVREVERQLLLHQGYDVTVAVDGMDGWNQVRAGKFDLVVTDVDMPRMSGLQLVQAVRADDRLKHLPVVIVSYKEREEDRLRGLEVGANYYLTKSSFHDNRFVQAVQDLIGTA